MWADLFFLKEFPYFNILNLCFNWSIVTLQCCVSLCCTIKWISYMCTYSPCLMDLPPNPPIPPLYVEKIPWRRAGQPTPVFFAWRIPWTEEPVDYSTWGWKELDTTEWLTFKVITGHPAVLPVLHSSFSLASVLHRVGHDWHDLAVATVYICRFYSLNSSHHLWAKLLNKLP